MPSSSKARKAKMVKNQPSIKNYFKRKQDEVKAPIPATSRPIKRRRACGMDDGSDGDGSGCKDSVPENKLPSSEGDRKLDSVQKASPLLLKCGESEMDCVHPATLPDDDSALISDGEQDVIDVEVGDNEYIACPDDDVEVNDKFEVIVTYVTHRLTTPVKTDTKFLIQRRFRVSDPEDRIRMRAGQEVQHADMSLDGELDIQLVQGVQQDDTSLDGGLVHVY
ncbi:hypothetical protein AtubIFM55763_006173 [Aspergillus tubingensis]|uniref:Uncharacterized protein n=1 Tax=Aspergillus tubingensis TaxID=5068 RepID=A0A9W6ERP6_ASPTU|nr:hypothetical protein AtubIFM54640_009810 [Aspergillus tubingensis]GLA74921.1 hypothetical protein AtubIFM55763_006173 [Aspergillus tubingensis]GLA89729.1 hypothetical protein AtubIFM56815_004217 [Aspergillus tubingensis]GLB00884.1 hypothetical protein AtubIFM57143_010252 [Aspergillus tubingensis]GLB14395.1 hypothetical protein AtubIFM61612_001821 [Aspergillus tubingensis]